jgi:6-phosphogluconolactonase
MQLEIVETSDALSRRTAETIARAALAAVATRGRFVMALSGGREPWAAFVRLAQFDLPWQSVHVLQVDERAAPAGHRARNWTHLEDSLLARVPIPRSQVYPMPVEIEPLSDGARRYADVLSQVAGAPAVIDLVHLGLGPDGHTASLVPSDPVVEVADAEVGVSEAYQGWRRMTLTLPAINRARAIVWLVAGKDKERALAQLIAGDPAIPAARVRRDGNVLLLADRATAGSPPAVI